VSHTSRKVLRGICLGAAIGGPVGFFLLGFHASWLLGAPMSTNFSWWFGAAGCVPGALLGMFVGGTSAQKSSREAELVQLRERVEELEAKASEDAIEAKKDRDERLPP